MLDPDASCLALERLFAQRLVADLPQLGRALGTSSRMSVFRRLSALGYLSSYSHTGRYYTLRSVPDFDTDGLWHYQGIGFSRDGTLKSTVFRLVEGSDVGRTQHELQLRLGVRVHNPLLELVESKKLGREPIDGEYLYVAAKRAQAAAQLERRRDWQAAQPLVARPSLEVEVLLEVIHGVRLPEPDAPKLAARLEARGIRASVAEVAAVLEHHGLKKTPRSRSRRSKR
jgi:hypothetical protein